MNILRALVGLGFVTAVAAEEAPQPVPDGWYLRGSAPLLYSAHVDSSTAWNGQFSAKLSSHQPDSGVFGTIMQVASAAPFRGHRVRMTAHVKGQEVAGWAGIWLRIDGHEFGGLAFDNMADRPITGDTDWQRYSVILDVPAEAASIAYGLLLSGSGSVWVDDVEFNVVDVAVPSTARPIQGSPTIRAASLNIPESPLNLDFEAPMALD